MVASERHDPSCPGTERRRPHGGPGSAGPQRARRRAIATVLIAVFVTVGTGGWFTGSVGAQIVPDTTTTTAQPTTTTASTTTTTTRPTTTTTASTTTLPPVSNSTTTTTRGSTTTSQATTTTTSTTAPPPTSAAPAPQPTTTRAPATTLPTELPSTTLDLLPDPERTTVPTLAPVKAVSQPADLGWTFFAWLFGVLGTIGTMATTWWVRRPV